MSFTQIRVQKGSGQRHSIEFLQIRVNIRNSLEGGNSLFRMQSLGGLGKWGRV
jgi:hypothetical protein